MSDWTHEVQYVPMKDRVKSLTIVALPDDEPTTIRIGVATPGHPWRHVGDFTPSDALRIAEQVRDLVHGMRP